MKQAHVYAAVPISPKTRWLMKKHPKATMKFDGQSKNGQHLRPYIDKINPRTKSLLNEITESLYYWRLSRRMNFRWVSEEELEK